MTDTSNIEQLIKSVLSSTLEDSSTFTQILHPLLEEIWRGNVCSSTRYLEALRNKIEQTTPDNPACKGRKIFSQNDEDGIIQECLRRLNSLLSHSCIEFCCGNGLENCTHALLINGYKGVWLDGNPENIACIKEGLGSLNNKKLWVRDDFLTLSNITGILNESLEFLNVDNIDVFVLDVDGNDIYFAEVIQKIIQPKIFVVEYNAKFPLPISVSIDYNEEHIFQWDDYQGASLQKFMDTLKNYTLVSCNLTGINAFFIRNDLMNYFTLYDPDLLFQPQRYEHVYAFTHRPTFKWLKQAINNERGE